MWLCWLQRIVLYVQALCACCRWLLLLLLLLLLLVVTAAVLPPGSRLQL
jgi:hypothetical protein